MSLWKTIRRGPREGKDAQGEPPGNGTATAATKADEETRRKQCEALHHLRGVEARLRALQAEVDVIRGDQ